MAELLRPIRSTLRRWLSAGFLAGGSPVLRWDSRRTDMALVHLCAVTAALLILRLDGRHPTQGDLAAWVTIALVFSGLRTASVGRSLAVSTLLLDAAGMAVFVAGTDAPGSPFYVLALAGAWWSAHVTVPRATAVYALGFVPLHLALVLPGVLGTQGVDGAVTEVVAFVGVAVLGARFVRVDRRALLLNEALYAAPFGAEQLAIRDGLVRALRTMDIPVDVMLTAGQVGLTAAQAELLSYLLLGLSNFEISDAVGVTEATVRYRLTRLYRTLGVRGRRAAAARAHELGLGAPVRPTLRASSTKA